MSSPLSPLTRTLRRPAPATSDAKSHAAHRAISRRRGQRDALWPDAQARVFQSSAGGWAKLPRTLPMIASLLDELAGKDKPGRLYLVLWAWDYGEGFIEVPDPVLLAAEAGYTSRRSERTFNERMRLLRELGFIASSPIGAREFGFVLLLDPHRAVERIRKERPGSVPDEWWSLFVSRCGSTGIQLATAAAPSAVKAPAEADPDAEEEP